jgi:NitT/TauT family transport system substrate-binding protein
MVRMLEVDREVDGVPVSYELASSPELVAPRVLTSEADFAVLPTNMAAKIAAGGVPYRLAALIGFGVVYVVSTDDSVRGWDDLKGRSVAAVGRGSAADAVFRYLSGRSGVEPGRDVQLRYLPHLELAQLLIAGREPIAMLPEPFVTRVLMQRPGSRVVLDLQEEWRRAAGSETPLAMSALVVRAATARRAPRLVKAFLARFADSTLWVNEHPREAGLLVEKHGLGFAAAEAEAAIPRCNIRFVAAAQARPAVEAFLAVLLASQPDSIGGKLPDDDFYLAP